MRNSFFLLIPLFLGGLTLSSIQAQDAEKPKGPERWEKDIAKFEEQDKTSPPPEKAILFVGSSSIRMWELEVSFPKRETINRGFGGSTIADSVHYFDRLVTPYAPKAIVVYAGDNDIKNGLTPEEVIADFEKLAALVSEKTPGTPLIYIAIKPSTSRWNLWPDMKKANDAIAAWCEKNDGFFFADIAQPMLADVEAGQPPKDSWFKEDGLHLTPEGYVGWKKVISAELKKALAKKDA